MEKSLNTYERMIEHVFIMALFAVYSVFGLLITTGAALSAGFATARSLKSDPPEAPTHVMFHRHFMETFKPSTIAWAIMVAIGLGITQLYFWAFDPAVSWRLVIFYILLFYWVIFMLYIFPVNSVFKHRSILHALKNTTLIIHLHPLVLARMLIIASVVFLLVDGVHAILTPVAITLYFYLQARWLSPTFDFYIKRLRAQTE